MSEVFPSFHARISAVYSRRFGAELLTDTPIGSTTLPLENVFDFDENGGSTTLGTELIPYPAQVMDDDFGVLALTGATAADHFAGDFAYSARTGGEIRAVVDREDVDEIDIDVRIPHRLIDVLPEGI